MKYSYAEFEKQWNSMENVTTFRKAVSANKDTVSLNLMREKLEEWFGLKLHSLGMVIDKVESVSDSIDFGNNVGGGFKVDCIKKHEKSLSRYIAYLALMLRLKDTEMKSLKASFSNREEEIKEELLSGIKKDEFLINLYKSCNSDEIKDSIAAHFPGLAVESEEEEGEED